MQQESQPAQQRGEEWGLEEDSVTDEPISLSKTFRRKRCVTCQKELGHLMGTLAENQVWRVVNVSRLNESPAEIGKRSYFCNRECYYKKEEERRRQLALASPSSSFHTGNHPYYR